MGKRVYFTVLSVSTVWFFFAMLIPLLNFAGGFWTGISDFGYYFYSNTCHQIESRSFHIFGSKMAVCSRCISVYAGFFVASAVYPFLKNINSRNMPPLIILLLAAGLLFADAVMDYFDILANSFLTRSITGLLAGLALPFYIIPGFVNFFEEMKEFYNRKKPGKEIKKRL